MTLLLCCEPFGAGTSQRADAGTVTPNATDAHVSDQVDAATSRYAQEVLSDGPIAYFRMGEAEGSAQVQSSQGTFVGDASKASLGVHGLLKDDPDTAVAVNETSHVNFGDHFSFDGRAPFTIELWLKADVLDSSFRMLFTKELLDTNDSQIDVHNVFVKDTRIVFERYVDKVRRSVEGTITTGQIMHVAASYDGTSMALFLDGALVDSSDDLRAAAHKPNSFYVGTPRPPNVKGFVGVVDELAIYDKALPLARVKAHSLAGR